MDIRSYRAKIKARNPEAVLEAKKDIAFQIGREFEKNRIAKGFTQKQVAEAVGTYQSNIARLERGTSYPSVRFLKKIADFLDTYIEFRLHNPPMSYSFVNSESATLRATLSPIQTPNLESWGQPDSLVFTHDVSSPNSKSVEAK